MINRVSNLLPYMFKLLIVSFVIFIVVRSKLVHDVLEKISHKVIFAAIVIQPIILISLVFAALRYLLLMGVNCRPYLFFAIRAIILSQGLNIVLPARLSEVVRAAYMRDHAAIALSRCLSAVILERTVDLFIVTILGFLASMLFFDRGDFSLIPIFGLVLASVIFVAIKFPGLVLRFCEIIPSSRIAKFILGTYQHFAMIIRARAFWRALVIGGLTWGISYINIFLFLELGGSLSVGLPGALLVFVLTTLGGAIPILPGGLGTYEAAAVIALCSLGYDYDEALALSLTLHASQLILPFLFAILIMLSERIGLLSLIADFRKDIFINKSSRDNGIKK